MRSIDLQLVDRNKGKLLAEAIDNRNASDALVVYHAAKNILKANLKLCLNKRAAGAKLAVAKLNVVVSVMQFNGVPRLRVYCPQNATEVWL